MSVQAHTRESMIRKLIKAFEADNVEPIVVTEKWPTHRGRVRVKFTRPGIAGALKGRV